MRFAGLAFCALLLGSAAAAAQTPPAPDLAGLWVAKARYGPDIRGP